MFFRETKKKLVLFWQTFLIIMSCACALSREQMIPAIRNDTDYSRNTKVFFPTVPSNGYTYC